MNELLLSTVPGGWDGYNTSIVHHGGELDLMQGWEFQNWVTCSAT